MLKYLYAVCGYACTQETQAYIHNGIMCTNKDIHSIQRTVVMRQNLQCYVLVCMIACMCIVVYYCVLCSVCHNSLHQCSPPPYSHITLFVHLVLLTYPCFHLLHMCVGVP